MRRAVLTAALLIVASALPVWAQHRGVSSGHGGVFVGGHPGRTVVRGGFGFGVRGGVAFGHNPRFGVFFGSRPFHHHRRFFRPFGFGYPFYPYYPVYPYTAYPYYGVGLQSDFVYSNGAVPQYASQAYTAERGAPVQSDLQRLQAELDEIKQQQALQNERQQYALSTPTDTPRPIPATRPRQEPSAPPTVLVFRDGRKLEVHNYAVTGQTLWIFSEARARKVPIADLDLDATRKANEERGVEFTVQARAPSPPSRY